MTLSHSHIEEQANKRLVRRAGETFHKQANVLGEKKKTDMAGGPSPCSQLVSCGCQFAGLLMLSVSWLGSFTWVKLSITLTCSLKPVRT